MGGRCQASCLLWNFGGWIQRGRQRRAVGGFADGGLGYEERRGRRESEAKKGKGGGQGGAGREGDAGERRT